MKARGLNTIKRKDESTSDYVRRLNGESFGQDSDWNLIARQDGSVNQHRRESHLFESVLTSSRKKIHKLIKHNNY